ncbi:hypothetical protein [Simiduia aestuariiviva]|uniref:DUF4136 domain-containing protein n=1 Tax=Simiduia aestuariiviva TaxID=1510459 RepID=A0A839UQQ0_9GAMM|nr:hypothetical protein [Simiduia aestuariiviva]MBB3168830.1 hypothetical protein [Simiduia aestuariiviva]
MQPKRRLCVLRLLLPLMISLLAACAGKVEVQGDFPQPLVDQKNLVVGLVDNPKFYNFQYEEKSKDRLKWTIGTGGAQQKLLSTVVGAMFKQVEPLKKIPKAGSPAPVDLVLLPRVKEFQYAMPRETKVNIFEVWIKYSIQIYDNQGALVADWIMPAYGKTPTAFLKSEEDALNQAVMMALRDAGASFITGFERVPEIKAWLALPRAPITQPRHPAPTLPDDEETL